MSTLFWFKGFIFDVLKESSELKFRNHTVGSNEICYCLGAENTPNLMWSPDFSSHRLCYLWSQRRSFETLINCARWECLKDAIILINSCSKHWGWNNFIIKPMTSEFSALEQRCLNGNWAHIFVRSTYFVHKHCVVLHLLQCLVFQAVT